MLQCPAAHLRKTPRYLPPHCDHVTHRVTIGFCYLVLTCCSGKWMYGMTIDYASQTSHWIIGVKHRKYHGLIRRGTSSPISVPKQFPLMPRRLNLVTPHNVSLAKLSKPSGPSSSTNKSTVLQNITCRHNGACYATLTTSVC